MDTQPTNLSVTTLRVERSIASRFNPLRRLTPQKVVRYIEDFRVGILRETAWAMECVEESDETLQSVAPKRKKSVSRLDWDVIAVEDAAKLYGPEVVEAQRKALKQFYVSLVARHAIEGNKLGGVSLLIRQMMDAVGKRYSVHEIAWHPQADGSLTADFTFVPLWFFENRTGKLRFLANEGDYTGQPLEPKQWLVHMGDGLMIACLIAYIYKTLPLKDWLTFSERNGMPAFVLTTGAAPGSPEWNNSVEMVHKIAAEFAAVISQGTTLDVKDLKAGATHDIYEKLVDRMGRAMAALWRGADLSTMSANDQQGASLQQSETDILQDDDVASINETLNTQVDRVVLDWIFGPGAPHAVKFRLRAPDRQDETALLNLVTQAVDRGVQVSQDWLREKLGIPAPKDGEAVLQPAQHISAGLPLPSDSVAANAAIESRAVGIASIKRGMDNDLQPLRVAMAKIQSARTAQEITAATIAANQLIERRALNMVLGAQLAAVTDHQSSQAVVAGAVDAAQASQPVKRPASNSPAK